MPSFNINEFSSALNANQGLARPNKFFVLLNPPAVVGQGGGTNSGPIPVSGGSSSNPLVSLLNFGSNLIGNGSFSPPQQYIRGDNNILTYLCNSASIPGVTIQTTMVNRNAVGPNEPFPSTPLYDDMQLQFLVDGSGKVLQFWTKWMQNIINFNTGYGNDNATSQRGANVWEVFYKEDYATDIEIIFLNDLGTSLIDVKLIDAFPIAMSPIALSWDSNDQVAVLPITLKYNYWTSTLFDTTGVGGSVDRGFNLLSALAQAGSVAAMVSTLKSPKTIGDYTNLYNNASLLNKAF